MPLRISVITAQLDSTQYRLVCHHPSKVFGRTCEILRPMLFGTNIAINIDTPRHASSR